MVPFVCDCDYESIMNLDSVLNSSHSSISESSCSTFSCVSERNGGVPSISCERPTRMSCGINENSNKPHKANDAAWEAIRALRLKDGGIGLKHFKLVRRLGSGDIGNVFLCELRGFGNCPYAMKVVDKEALAYRNKLHRAEMEKQILSLLDHPFLPTLYAHFEAAHYSCVVMEFCPGGDLHSLRHRQPGKRFSLRSARFYAAEVLLALEYLHMMGIIFRDLKPENVLVRKDGHIMLSDFDLSLRCNVVPILEKSREVNPVNPNLDHPKRMNKTASSSAPSRLGLCSPIEQPTYCIPIVPRTWFNFTSSKKKTKTSRASTIPEPQHPELVVEPSEARSRSFVGTHEYLAPEVTSGEGHGSAVDWWTFGVFLFELLYGRTPFKGANNETTLLNIISQPLKFPHNPNKDMEAWDTAKDLIRRLLAKDPRRRLGSTRGSADIKTHPFFKGINWALIRSTAPPEIPGIRRTKTCYERQKPLQPLPPHFDYF
eukprot:Gb_00478 [translate_table: standard]